MTDTFHTQSSRLKKRLQSLFAVKILVAIAVATTMPSASAFDASGGGRYVFPVSAQACQVRYDSQGHYLIRSTYSQLINRRPQPLQIVCPIPRTYLSDPSRECATPFVVRVYFRSRPSVSTDQWTFRFSLASVREGFTPAIYRQQSQVRLSDMTWDNRSTYTEVYELDLSVPCGQFSATGNSVNIDSNIFVQSLYVIMPPGGQIRGMLASGGKG